MRCLLQRLATTHNVSLPTHLRVVELADEPRHKDLLCAVEDQVAQTGQHEGERVLRVEALCVLHAIVEHPLQTCVLCEMRACEWVGGCAKSEPCGRFDGCGKSEP